MRLKQLAIALLTPGWEAAELILPWLHLCIFSLICFLIYCVDYFKDDPSLQIHFKCMGFLTLLLWASIYWFTNMYRQVLKEEAATQHTQANGNSNAENNMDECKTESTLPPNDDLLYLENKDSIRKRNVKMNQNGDSLYELQQQYEEIQQHHQQPIEYTD